MPEAVIVSTARSPIGRAFKGSLKDVRPDDLAAAIVTAALAKVPALDPAMVDDLYLGCAEPGASTAPTWPAWSPCWPATTTCPAPPINRFCASSVQTTRMAFHAIKAGEGDVFISAGVEAVSRYVDFAGAGGSKADWQNPRFAEAGARSAAHRGRATRPWTDPREDGQLPDVYLAMGQTAENVAGLRGITRERQDEWGVASQNRAEKAIADGFFAREITPDHHARRHRRQHRRRPPPRRHAGEGVRP